MQAGSKLEVRLRAARPDGSVLRPQDGRGAVMAAFYAPGKDPRRLPADRAPDAEVPLVFDEASRTYAAEVPTAGWEPGAWTLRGAVLDAAGAPAGWAWHVFTLEP